MTQQDLTCMACDHSEVHVAWTLPKGSVKLASCLRSVCLTWDMLAGCDWGVLEHEAKQMCQLHL